MRVKITWIGCRLNRKVKDRLEDPIEDIHKTWYSK